MVSASIGPSRAARPIDERDRPAREPTRAAEPDGAAPRDRVTVSREAQARATGASGPGGKLTPEQQRDLVSLRQRDSHVRQHEAAHQAAGGSLTGGASFSFQVGPDGRSYAVGGEVPVRLAPGRTPDETIQNARQARRAALAPSDPSPADLSVAASAMQMEQAAQQRKARLAAKAYGKQPGREDEVGKAEGSSDSSGGSQEEGEEPVSAGKKAA